MPIQLPILNMAGQQVGTIDLDERVFGQRRNDTLIHQVVVAQQANRRVGTANTKTRGDMKWGGAKPYRQKGTGRARQGSRTAPHYRGGGVVWGPHPRDYRQAIPRKMRRGALRSVLSAKVRDNQLIVLDELRFPEPRTKAMIGVLQALGVDNALVVLTESCDNVRLSANNIPKIDTCRADSVNVLEVMTRRHLIMPVEALRLVEANLADDNRRITEAAAAAGVPGSMIRTKRTFTPSTVTLVGSTDGIAGGAAAGTALGTAAPVADVLSGGTTQVGETGPVDADVLDVAEVEPEETEGQS